MPLVKEVHHIGIAVHSIEDRRAFYESTLGGVFEGTEEVAEQRVVVGFFRIGGSLVELLEPTSADSPIAKFLAERGEGLHHIAFAVDDIEARISELRESGLRMIDDVPRTGAHGMQIAFVHPSSTSGVLTELCEPKSVS